MIDSCYVESEGANSSRLSPTHCHRYNANEDQAPTCFIALKSKLGPDKKGVLHSDGQFDVGQATSTHG